MLLIACLGSCFGFVATPEGRLNKVSVRASSRSRADKPMASYWSGLARMMLFLQATRVNGAICGPHYTQTGMVFRASQVLPHIISSDWQASGTLALNRCRALRWRPCRQRSVRIRSTQVQETSHFHSLIFHLPRIHPSTSHTFVISLLTRISI